MGKTNKTTIYTLGREAGVSPATVSRALGNSHEVSAEVRRKIRRIARARGFRPRVVTRRVPNICVLIQQKRESPLSFYSYLSSVLSGVAEYAHQENIEMSLYAAHIDELNRCDLVGEFAKRRIDGAVILGSSARTRFLPSLAAQRFPYVCLFTDDGKRSDRLLTVDNEAAAYRAANLLIEYGHRRIAVLATPASVQTGQDRLRGYRRALEEAGVACDEALIHAAPGDSDALAFARGATERLLRERPGVTALFVMSHTLALGALHALWRMGLRVPGHVSVLACDDFPETPFLCPPLTVVRIPNHELGHLAARQTHRLIQGLPLLDLSHEAPLRGELVIRESVGKPRNGKLPCGDSHTPRR